MAQPSTKYLDIQQFTAISITGMGQSCIGSGCTAIGWTVADLGVSATRTISALESSTPKVALALAALTWDLEQAGVIKRA